MKFQTSKIDSAITSLTSPVAHTPHHAKQLINCGDIRVVLTEPPVESIQNRNVYGYSASGELLWQIQESPHGTQTDKPYTSLHVNDQEQLIAGNWNGVDYSVDLENGTVTATSFDK